MIHERQQLLQHCNHFCPTMGVASLGMPRHLKESSRVIVEASDANNYATIGYKVYHNQERMSAYGGSCAPAITRTLGTSLLTGHHGHLYRAIATIIGGLRIRDRRH